MFFDETATLFDYLADDTVTVTVGDIDDAMQRFGQDTASRYGFLKSDRERPVPPSALFLDPETLHGKLKDFRRLALTAGQPHPDFRAAPDVSVARRAEDPVAKLRALVQGRQSRLLLCADSAGRRETLVQMLNEFGVTPDAQPDSIEAFLSSDAHFGIAAAPLSAGFGLPGAGLAFLTENDLYPGLATTGRRGKRDQERASNVEAMVRDLSELRAGDPVVHAQHGIGRYHGLVNMDMGEGEMEFLHLEYANGSTLYVPVSQLHVIARYSGADPEAAPLHQLGSGQWDKARRKAAKQVRDTAAELLALYAQRTAREGYAFKLPLNDYEAFAEGFGFEETADQAAAIQAVIADMTSGRPMDRLVWWRRGLRQDRSSAARRLPGRGQRQAGRPAVPDHAAGRTARPNLRTASPTGRCAWWNCRARSAKEVATAIEGINDGRVDIVIGTHKIPSKDVKFKRLGLVIIDEEHRFGVRQKER